MSTSILPQYTILHKMCIHPPIVHKKFSMSFSVFLFLCWVQIIFGGFIQHRDQSAPRGGANVAVRKIQ